MQVHNFIRGLSPRPCAFTFHDDILLKVYRSKIIDTAYHEEHGKILDVNSRLVIGTGSGAIEILEIQQEGKKKLSAEEFLRGYKVRAGDIFQSKR